MLAWRRSSSPIEDSCGHLHPIEVVIDTGFTGDLTLSRAQVTALGLAWFGRVVGQLADGSQQMIDVYDAILMWDYAPTLVKVEAVETQPLLARTAWPATN